MSFPIMTHVFDVPENTFLLKAYVHKLRGTFKATYSQFKLFGLGVSPECDWLVPITADSTDIPKEIFTLLLRDGTVYAPAGVPTGDEIEFENLNAWLNALEKAALEDEVADTEENAI